MKVFVIAWLSFVVIGCSEILVMDFWVGFHEMSC